MKNNEVKTWPVMYDKNGRPIFEGEQVVTAESEILVIKRLHGKYFGVGEKVKYPVSDLTRRVFFHGAGKKNLPDRKA